MGCGGRLRTEALGPFVSLNDGSLEAASEMRETRDGLKFDSSVSSTTGLGERSFMSCAEGGPEDGADPDPPLARSVG
jgi:hypothetical protein